MGTDLCLPNLYKMANHSHDQLVVQALNVLFTIKASHLKNENPNVQTVGENTGGPKAVTKSGVAFALKQIMNQDQRSVRLLSKTRRTSYPLLVPITHYQISFRVPYMFLESIIAPQNTLFNMLKPFAAEISQRLQLYRQQKRL